MGINFKVDEEKCIHCGRCIKDCMSRIFAFNENKIPTVIEERENNCIKCQHCLSVCPTGAISVLGKEPQNSVEFKHAFNSDEVLQLIKERRSVRFYKKQNVEKETIQKLKDMLSYVPTGVNNHGLHFSFVEDVSVMDKFREKVKDVLVNLVSTNKIAQKKFGRYADAIVKGNDIIFRGAPHMVVVSSPKNAPCKDVDPIIALSYFELYAKSLGIGTCWCGLAYACFTQVPGLKNIIKVPHTHDIAYVMLFGYPDIDYSRSTQPEPFEIATLTALNEEKESFFMKVA